MIEIRTDRGLVRVVDKQCAHRPCLHVHWSERAARFVRDDKRTGARIIEQPLVCMRNEEHGCPQPLPDPKPDPGR